MGFFKTMVWRFNYRSCIALMRTAIKGFNAAHKRFDLEECERCLIMMRNGIQRIAICVLTLEGYDGAYLDLGLAERLMKSRQAYAEGVALVNLCGAYLEDYATPDMFEVVNGEFVRKK